MLKMKDILAMGFAKDFTVVSGNCGLRNVVKSVGINDYETLEDIPRVFGKGDFLLTSLALYKREGADIGQYLKAFMDAGVAAIGIKNVNEQDLSDEILSYSDRRRIPIILTPKELYTEDLIFFIRNMLKQDQKQSYLELRISKALDGQLTEQEEKELLKDVKADEFEELSVYYLRKRDDTVDVDKDYVNLLNKYDELLPHLGVRLSKYQDGIFLFNNKHSSDTVDELLTNYGVTVSNYAVGVSDYSIGGDITLNKVLEHSIAAADVCLCEDTECMHYNDIGVYKYILPLDPESNLYQEYQNRFEPIIAYDMEKEANLVETALRYMNNNGNIIKTSEELFLHVNTTRYRLKRIRDLLGYSSEKVNEFYVDLVLMTMIYKLKKAGRAPFV